MAKKKTTEADFQADWDSNPMRLPRVEKVVVNICVGKAGEEIQKAQKVLEQITNQKAVLVKAKKSVKEWDIRQGQSIAVKVTLRGDPAIAFIKKMLFVTNNQVLKSSFDGYGNFSVGLDEHIKLPEMKYSPELGIFGFTTAIRIARPGSRVKIRRKMRSKIEKSHYVSKHEAMYFMQKTFQAEVVDKIEEKFY